MRILISTDLIWFNSDPNMTAKNKQDYCASKNIILSYLFPIGIVVFRLCYQIEKKKRCLLK